MNAYDGAPQSIRAAALARDWKLRRIHSLSPLVRAVCTASSEPKFAIGDI